MAKKEEVTGDKDQVTGSGIEVRGAIEVRKSWVGIVLVLFLFLFLVIVIVLGFGGLEGSRGSGSFFFDLYLTRSSGRQAEAIRR
jgi:hypothetical protein